MSPLCQLGGDGNEGCGGLVAPARVLCPRALPRWWGWRRLGTSYSHSLGDCGGSGGDLYAFVLVFRYFTLAHITCSSVLDVNFL